MVIKARRIPANSNTAYTSWSFPNVSQGRVIKASNARAHKRVPAAMPAQAQARAVTPPSMAQQVTANIKAGKYVQGVSAKDLESIVVESAREGREAGYADGHRKGLKQGLEQGHKEGLENGQAIIEDAAHRLSMMLNSLNAPIAGQEEGIRTAMIDAIVRISEEVIRRELETRPEVIAGLVGEAVAAMPVGADNLTVKLNSADIELLRNAGQPLDPKWNVVADDTLANGDCRVEAGDSLVDYSQSERLAGIISQFLDGAGGDNA